MNSGRITSAIVRSSNRHVLTAVLTALLCLSLPTEASIIGSATLIKDPSKGLPFASPDSALVAVGVV